MNASAPAIGLINLGPLASEFARIGLRVITGDDFRTAATSIRAELDAGAPFPILVSDTPWPGMRAWMEKTARQTRVVVVHGAEGNGTEFVGTSSVHLPSSVDDVLVAAGFAPNGSTKDRMVSLDGAVGIAQAAPVPVPVAQPVPVTVPAEPEVSSTPAQPPAQPVVTAAEDDPWEDDEPVAPVVEVFAPAPVETPVAPVIETVSQPAVEPLTERPEAPVVPVTFEPPAAPVPAPVGTPVIEDDPWEEEPIPAPVVEAPAAPAPVAQPVAQPTIDEPVQPVVSAPADFPVSPPAAQASQPVVFEPPVSAGPQVVESPAPVQQPESVEVAFAPPAIETQAPSRPSVPVDAPTGAIYRDPLAVPTADPTQEAQAAPVIHRGPVEVEPLDDALSSGAPVVEAVAPFIAPPSRPAEEFVAPPVVESPAASDAGAAAMQLAITPAKAGPGLAETVIVWAGKGGVGKSTSSFSLAQRAAKAGLRVILIDANFGQGDMRTFLRVGNAGLPSVYQAALSGDIKQALVDPDTLNAARSPKLDPLGFALVQAPPAHLTDPEVITPEVYMNVVEQARKVCDVVVIDTQIIEPGTIGTNPMVTRLIAPLLRAGAWGVGVSDLSSAGISNLLTDLKWFAGAGVSRDREVTALNRIPRGVQFNVDGVASAFNEHSTFLGIVYDDSSIPEAMNRGRAVSNNAALAPLLDAALSRITGLDEFSPNASAAAEAAADMAGHGERAKGGGFLSRFRKKG